VDAAALEAEVKVDNVQSNFYPDNPLEQAVQAGYLSTKHKRLSVSDIRIFVESTVSYDGLFEDFLRNPQSVSQELFDSTISDHVFVPCYTVELRNILKSKTIVSNYKIAAFSLESAKKYLTDYGVLLVFDVKKLVAHRLLDLDGIQVFESELHFGDSLVKVLSRARLDGDNTVMVDKIVADECPHLTVGVLTDVPGIAPQKQENSSSHKQAQVQNLKKYIINIPSMGLLKEVIRSTDPKSAIQEGLDRKWKATGSPHKNPEYTADYWLNSPTLQGDPNLLHHLIHEATGDTYLIKMASKSELKLPLHIESDEQEIFDLLLKVNKQYNLGLTFRVAGGWVRDRALGITSKDVDIALDKMTGVQFCKYLTKATGKQPAIIAADTDKSKSLETATINLGEANIPVDFVNLRKEVYEPGSRVPTMTIGTPKEDAERRDFTFNSLFYNINTGQLEDLTGKGLDDLSNLVIRTPLPPEETFKDDPLRVFRGLRFFAKIKGSKIADETLKAMYDPKVQEALDPKNTIDVEVVNPKTGKRTIEKQRKISEERILTEWQKLHKGPQAAQALRIVHDSGLWQKVFLEGAKDEEGKPLDLSRLHPFTMDQNNVHHVDNVLEHTLKVVEQYDAILRADNADDDERARLLAAAFMHDLGKLDPEIIGEKDVEGIIRNTYHGHEDVSEKATRAILRGIKASNEEIEEIATVVKNHMIPHDKMTDKQINKMIRQMGRKLVRRIVQHAKADVLSKPGADVAHYDKLLERVENAKAVEPKMVRPVVNGGIIMQMFPTLDPKSGFIKEIQDHLQDIKDGNPQLIEQDGIMEIERMRSQIQQKYQSFVPQKKVPQQKPPVQTPKSPTVSFNLSKQGAGSVELICGEIKMMDGILSIDGNKGSFNLKTSEEHESEIKKLVGKRICGKGMIHRKDFIVSEYTIVHRDPNQDVVPMERQTPQEMNKFQVGDKVRHRKRGLAFQQIMGMVARVDGNLMYVKWDNVEEEEVFDLQDPVPIFGTLQKV